MTDIVVHTFKDQQVRTILGSDGEPRFVLADLCKVLDINNASDVARRLSDSMKGVDLIDTPGGRQKMTVVTEAGMYSVVLRSDKPEAVSFQEWVTGDVLPSIRRTGDRLIESVTTLITGKDQEDLINGFLNGSYSI